MATNYEAAQAFLSNYSRQRAAINATDASRAAEGLPPAGERARAELATMLEEAKVYAVMAVADELRLLRAERPARTASGELLPKDAA